MVTYIDSFLNKFTTYRFTLYYLIILFIFALIYGYIGVIPYTAEDLLINILIAIIVGYVSNYLFAALFKAKRNTESVFITSIILVLIIPAFPADFLYILGASGLAMASKYLITIEKRHIFNPAAVSVAAIALLSPTHIATWWIGSVYILPIVVIGGVLLVRKIGKEKMVYTFIGIYILLTILSIIINGLSISQTLNLSLLSSPILFFAFIMLTEPISSPTREKLQIYYAIFAAILFSTPELRILNIGITPELSLCGANLFSYIINPNYHLDLILDKKERLSQDTMYFIFKANSKIKYLSGQYMEWMLPHDNTDNRGNRRYFSLASSPSEDRLAITVRFFEKSSSYKKALYSLNKGDSIIASELSGDFILPTKSSKGIVFIAGGVGIAPFRSILKYIIDKRVKMDITLFYSVRSEEDILFSEILAKSKYSGVKVIYTITEDIPSNWKGERGFIDSKMIQRHTEDYKSKLYYISGPQLMVDNMHHTLLSMGIRRKNIKEDFFPGYNETGVSNS